MGISFDFDFLKIALTVATVAAGAFQIISSFKQADFVEKQGRAEVEAAQASTKLYIEELDRQVEEARQQEETQVSERMREAKRELASVSVAALERGTGLTTLARLQNEVGFYEDLDITTIRANTDDFEAANDARRKSAEQGVINTMTAAENRTDSAQLNAKLGVFSTGLQVASGIARNKLDQRGRSNIIT